MYVRTGQEDTLVGEDFVIGRVKHRIFRQSLRGRVVHQPEPRAIGTATMNTVGADFLFGTSTFLGAQNLSVGGFVLNTNSPRATGAHNAYGVQVDYPNDPWSASLLYREVQANYDAAVGFTPRTGFRRVQPSVSLRPASAGSIRGSGRFNTEPPETFCWIRTRPRS